jgi:prepilin-type N-terminal cleavage/methylation domain-containing protein
MELPFRAGMTRNQPRRRIAGFTLTELMITLLIAGIILGIAGPRFVRFISHLSARGAASQVVADLTLARTQAVREGVTTSFLLDSPTQYRIEVSGTPARTVKTVNLQRDHPGVRITGATVAFDSRGMARDLGNSGGTLTISRGQQVDVVRITAVGRVLRDR